MRTHAIARVRNDTIVRSYMEFDCIVATVFYIFICVCLCVCTRVIAGRFESMGRAFNIKEKRTKKKKSKNALDI